MAKKIGGLGRGLDILFSESDAPVNLEHTPLSGEGPSSATPYTVVRISDVEPDKSQPRKAFDEEALQSLADSIAAHGVLQPLVVRPAAREDDPDEIKERLAGKYRIVSGERRWRASRLAGLTEVPVVVKDLSDTEAGAIMLVENLQREDLNPVETAQGLKRLTEEYGLTHEETARVVGISRPNLTNYLRLLQLPSNALSFLAEGSISVGHARALLPLVDEKAINEAVDVILAKQMSVRATEKYVKTLLDQKNAPPVEKKPPMTLDRRVYMEKLAERVSTKLGRKANLAPSAKKKGGVLTVEYYDDADLEALLRAFCGNDVFED